MNREDVAIDVTIQDKHPEQAGGDERVIGWRERILAAHPNSDPGFWTDALLVEHMAAEIEDLRAALAQPSQAQAEHAEAERPEQPKRHTADVFYHNHFSTVQMEVVRASDFDEFAAQHDRIVGALRAENAKLSEALDRWPLIRDSLKLRLADALARVAGLELGIARIAGDFLPDNSGQAELALDEMRQALHELLAAAPTQAQHSVPDGAADLCRFLAKLYCELDGLRYSTAKLPAEQIADALIFKWPVLQGARNQLNIKRISEQPYDESKLHSAIAAMLAAAPGKEVGHE